MTDTNTLAPCPFCGAGVTIIRENGLVWQGVKYGGPSSVSVLHHCDRPPGQPHRPIERVGKDRSSAIAAWNRRAPTTQPAPAAQGDAWRDLLWQIADALECTPCATDEVLPNVQAIAEDAARYRFLAAHCRSTPEHWGGRWSIVVEGPAPKSHDSEDDFDAAIDAARAAKEGDTQ